VSELFRLEGRSQRGKATLILTESHVVVEPDEGFRTEIDDELAKGREGAEKAPGVIGWVVGKAMHMATRAVEKAFSPHPLQEVDLVLRHDRLQLRLGALQILSELEVDPTEAFLFESKFRDAKKALERR